MLCCVDSSGGIVRELTDRVLERDEKIATTIRLNRRTIKRLRVQERRWATSMSFLIERALEPVLDELEHAQAPGDEDGDS